MTSKDFLSSPSVLLCLGLMSVRQRNQNKCSLFSTVREPSVNRKDLPGLTLVGPPKDIPELDPLAALHLNN